MSTFNRIIIKHLGSMSNILKSTWSAAIQHSGLDSLVTDDWWKIIEQRYSEKQRYYHTLRHVEHMCTLMDEYKHKLADQHSVFYSIVFHDVIYEPTQRNNEERSADLFMEFARECKLSVGVMDKVRSWILLTKSHSTPVHTTPGATGTDDLHYFLDFDMAILGSAPTDYKVYADQIRNEYIHVTDDMYRSGRAKVLKSFLEIPNIFATEEFQQRFEEQARHNVQEEIRELQT